MLLSKNLGAKQLYRHGDQYGVGHKSERQGLPDMLAFVWIDRKRRYLISTCDSLHLAEPVFQQCWRQGSDIELQEQLEKVCLSIPVFAAATRRSVWRARNAGIWRTSQTSLTGFACSGKWISVVTSTPSLDLTLSRISSPFSIPSPRKELPLLRFALSNEALKT